MRNAQQSPKMQDIQPLRLSTHATLSWHSAQTYHFAADTLMLPVAMTELAQVGVSMPLGFSGADKPSLVTLTGLRPGENLFVAADGFWSGDYLPASLRSYPFKLLPPAEGKFSLGFDHASGLIAAAGEGEAFFTPAGKPTERLQRTLEFLVRHNAGLGRSDAAAARLQQHGLLEPWPLEVKDAGGDTAVEGLWRVSERKLATLDDAAFLSLRAGGVLALAYAQLLSMANIATLGKLARLRAQSTALADKHQAELRSMFVPPQPEDEIDWDAMLKDDKD